MFENGYSTADAARHNQIDNLNNGVIGYEPSEHSKREGPLNVQVDQSADTLQLDVEGGPHRVEGVRVDVTPEPVGLSNGDPDLPREDLVIATEDGGIDVLPGRPMDNVMLDRDGNTYAPVGPYAAEPVPSDDAVNGSVLASVFVPRGATAGDLSTDKHVHDRRMPALIQPPDPRSFPNESWGYNSLGRGTYITRPASIPPGYSLRVWLVALGNSRQGWSSNWGTSLQLVDLDEVGPDPSSDELRSGDHILYEQFHAIEEADFVEDDPIIRLDHPASASGQAKIGWRMYNRDNVEFDVNGETGGLSFQLSYSLDPTGRIE